MNWHAIIFTGESIPQILAENKTQTRRIILPQPIGYAGPWSQGIEAGDRYVDQRGVVLKAVASRGRNKRAMGELTPQAVRCPYGVPGDGLWVKEAFTTKYDRGSTWVIYERVPGAVNHISVHGHIYAKSSGREMPDGRHSPRWMPRGLSRISLKVMAVRVQRLQDISEEDAIAEGVTVTEAHIMNARLFAECRPDLPRITPAQQAYCERWDALNKKRGHGWDLNEFVFPVTFKLLKDDTNG